MPDNERNAMPVRRAPGPPGRGRGRGGKIDFKTLIAEKDTLKRLLGYIWKPYKLRLVLVFLCIVISSFAGAKGNQFLETLINDHVVPLIGVEAPDFGPLTLAVLEMGLIYLAGLIAGFLSKRLMIVVTQGTMKNVRNEMFSKLQRLPIRYFDTTSYGDIMSRFSNDTDTLRQMISQSLSQAVGSMVSVVAVLAMMLSLSVPLTIVVVVMVSLMLLCTGKVGGISGKYFTKQQIDLANVNAYIEEMIEGQKVIKVFNHEKQAVNNFVELNEELNRSATVGHTMGGILMPINMNLGNLTYLVVGVVGGLLAFNGIGNIKIGTIVAFLVLTRQFSMPITSVSQQLNSIIMALAGAKRIFQVIDETEEEDEGDVGLVNVRREDGRLVKADGHSRLWAWQVPDADEPDGYKLVELRGDVRLNDVSFSYVEGKEVLHDINIYAKPGQKVAFVGHTGAGKTTITNLLNRFYDVQQGSIFYDGIDVMRIKKTDLRHALGMVLQDTNLFTGTIMDNIRYGRLDATDDECIGAAMLANADSFIRLLPQGYDTVISGTGGSLSQGQRQLLNIARCAVADPPVMILDEATSSIDTRTEMLIQNGMDALMEGRTVFVIAHRLSTIQNASAIMVMENGRIIERGDHDDLIAAKGTYYKLYTGAVELD